MKKTSGALLLGNEYQALGLLRQLQSQGIPCALVDHDRWGPARFSRFRCPFHQSPAYTSSEFWPWLAALARKHGYEGWVVIPTDDEQVRQLALHYDEACTLFHYAGLPWSTYQCVYDKRAAYAWASQLGIRLPITFVPTDRDEPPRGLPYPAIIKPAVKPTFSRYTKQKAIQIGSPAELWDRLDNQLAEVPIEDLLYQEVIPGDGRYQWSYAGLFWHGQPVAAFTACRARQHPPDFGRASTYVTALYDPEVEAESRKVLAALDYCGLAEVEWKRDPRDKRLKFLEVNARCWGWHSLAARVVGNLPAMLYDCLVNGGAAHAVRPVYGSRWIKWITDVPVAVDLMRRGELQLTSYAASLCGNVVGCDWDRCDPVPFFVQLALLPYLMVKRGY